MKRKPIEELSNSEIDMLRSAYNDGYRIAWKSGHMFNFYRERDYIYYYNKTMSEIYVIPIDREINLTDMFSATS